MFHKALCSDSSDASLDFFVIAETCPRSSGSFEGFTYIGRYRHTCRTTQSPARAGKVSGYFALQFLPMIHGRNNDLEKDTTLRRRSPAGCSPPL